MRRFKKFAAFIAAALVFAIAVPLFAACTPRTDGGEHSQHDYDPASGVWEWNDDLTEAYYVLTCLDAGCGHVERMPAEVRDISGADGPTCTEGGVRRARASVILDGRGHIDEESKEMGARQSGHRLPLAGMLALRSCRKQSRARLRSLHMRCQRAQPRLRGMRI